MAKKEAQAPTQEQTVSKADYDKLLIAAQNLENQLKSANARLTAIANIVNI